MSTISTTTTVLSRLRGLTLEILSALHDSPMTVPAISHLVEREQRYTRVYLHNMRRYGLTSKTSHGFWELTEKGELTYTILYYTIILKIKERRKKDKSKIKERKKFPVQTRQIKIDSWLGLSNPTEAEAVVVEVLVKHYNETGSKFIYARDQYEFAEIFNISADALAQALVRLKQDHIVYHWKDKSLDRIKLGLYKDFVVRLQVGK